MHDGTAASPNAPSRLDQKFEEFNRNNLKNIVSQYYPNLVPECALQETCFYSVSKKSYIFFL